WWVRPTFAATSGGAEEATPRLLNAAQERGIDDPRAERVDEGHVDGRQAADRAHVHPEIKAIGRSPFDERAHRRGVGGPIPDLEQLLVLEPVNHPERALAPPRRREGSRPIGGGQTSGEGLPRRRVALPIPTEEPARAGDACPQRPHTEPGE